MNKLSSISSSMVETTFSSAALIALTLVSGVLVARILGPDGRGVYGAFLFWSQISILLLNFSIFEAFVIRSRNQKSDPLIGLPLLVLIGAIFSFLCVFFFTVAFDLGFISIQGIPLDHTMGLFAVFTAIGFLNLSIGAIERARLSFHRLNIERVLTPTVFMTSMILLYWYGIANVFYVLLSYALSKALILIYRAWRFRYNFIGPIDRSMGRHILSLGVRLHAGGSLHILAGQVDRLFVVALWSSERIGFYLIAYSAVGAGMSLASQAIQMTMLPHLAGLIGKARRQVVERMLRVAILFGGAMALLVWGVAPWVIPVLYGANFTPAVQYVQWMSFSMMLIPCLSAVNVANRALERSRPGVEMGLIALAIFAVAYAFTGFEEPKWLFVTMFFANIASISKGLQALASHGTVRVGRAIVPNHSDIVYIGRVLFSRVRKIR